MDYLAGNVQLVIAIFVYKKTLKSRRFHYIFQNKQVHFHLVQFVLDL